MLSYSKENSDAISTDAGRYANEIALRKSK